MIQASTPLLPLLQSGSYTRADLYTFTLTSGAVLRWASFATAIAYGGNLYGVTGVNFVRDKWKVTIGLQTDSFNVTLSVNPGNEPSINGVPLRQAARGGLFDGAQCQMDWAYLSGSPPSLVGVVPRFFGQVGQSEVDRLGVRLTINSPLKLLDMSIPAKIYGPPCRWTLGDSDCGVDLSSFAQTATIGAGATEATIPTSLTDADGTWNLAQIQMTSGFNQGLRRFVRSYVGGTLILNSPLPWAPVNGDGFTITPGCDHAMPSFTASVTVPTGGGAVTVAPGAANYFDEGVVYASGPHAGQPLILTRAALSTGQYQVNGNVYAFAAGDAGASLTVTYVAEGGNAVGTCARLFNNLARFGGTPFIPAPEVGI